MSSSSSSSALCSVRSYLCICVSAKILLLIPAFTLNVFTLVSLLSCLLSRNGKIKSNVAVFIVGSTLCNLANLALWPLTIHWGAQGRWELGSGPCELMVSLKHLTSSASFHYVSFISFSIYLTVVWNQGKLVDSKSFLFLQLVFPLLPVGLKELVQWVLQSHVEHLDPVNHTCFSFINDRTMRVLVLVKVVVFLPLNLYFYGHLLHTIFRSAQILQRSQETNKRLAKVFALIAFITLLAHLPSGVFSMMQQPSVCQEMVKDVLTDLPLLSSPVVLLCMNKELQTHCLHMLHRKPHRAQRSGGSVSCSAEQKNLTTEETLVTST